MALNHQSWIGVADPKYGYGAMLTGFLEHLPPDVRLNPKASTQVYMGLPRGWPGHWEGQRNVLFTMWETTELPTKFVRYLPMFDQILVPCEHNVKLFSQWHNDVRYVPLGVDTKFWSPMERPNNPVFRIHAAGSLWRRKGLDALVDAFMLAGLDAELHIKAAPHALDVPAEMPDKVFLHRQWMTLEEQRDWVNQADVFVAPSRGEGFGLFPLQAIALGVPTIITATSGQAQFAHLATAVCRHAPINADTLGKWDEPDRRHLADLLRQAFENRHEWQTRASQLAASASEFSWNKAAQRLVDAVPAGKLLRTDTFHEAFMSVDVEAVKPVEADIAGVKWRHQKGERFTVPDGAYQVLFDAGVVRAVVQ